METMNRWILRLTASYGCPGMDKMRSELHGYNIATCIPLIRILKEEFTSAAQKEIWLYHRYKITMYQR